MCQYFPKPYSCFGGYIKAELDLSNCVTYSGGSKAIDVNVILKKWWVKWLDFHKSKAVPTNLSILLYDRK